MKKRKPLLNFRRVPGVRKGPPSYSTRVRRRHKDARAFCAWVHQYKDVVSEGFGELFAAEFRDGEQVPDHALALEVLSGPAF